MKEEEKIKQIFIDIEKAITETISDKPVEINNSKFIERLKEIKKRYVK